MTSAPDLFGFQSDNKAPQVGAPHYPAIPGSKVGGTSSAAARAIKPGAAQLRKLALADVIGAGIGGTTTDETAQRLGRSILSIRPRFSELLANGLIKKTGLRRTNESGMSATVWRATETGP